MASEQICYRKVGDHATKMPNVIRFVQKNGANLEEKRIRYTYDKCGNIEKVYENDELTARYGYDALNRIVREDNKRFGKTYLYGYDNNGNILYKKETAFTLTEETDGLEFEAKK